MRGSARSTCARQSFSSRAFGCGVSTTTFNGVESDRRQRFEKDEATLVRGFSFQMRAPDSGLHHVPPPIPFSVSLTLIVSPVTSTINTYMLHHYFCDVVITSSTCTAHVDGGHSLALASTNNISPRPSSYHTVSTQMKDENNRVGLLDEVSALHNCY